MNDATLERTTATDDVVHRRPVAAALRSLVLIAIAMLLIFVLLPAALVAATN
jgi:hypothetical protein